MLHRLNIDRHGERCAWREPDSIPVLGPSIRADPVLGLNHYIREMKLERNGDSRVDIQMEVCQYEREFDNCKEDKMTDQEMIRLTQLKQQLDAAKEAIKHKNEDKTSTVAPSTSSAAAPSSTTPSHIAKISDNEKVVEAEDKNDDLCASVITSECGKNIHARITACCKDLAACDRVCLKGVEKSLLDELIRNERGCTTREVRQTLDCLARKVTNLAH